MCLVLDCRHTGGGPVLPGEPHNHHTPAPCSEQAFLFFVVVVVRNGSVILLLVIRLFYVLQTHGRGRGTARQIPRPQTASRVCGRFSIRIAGLKRWDNSWSSLSLSILLFLHFLHRFD